MSSSTNEANLEVRVRKEFSNELAIGNFDGEIVYKTSNEHPCFEASTDLGHKRKVHFSYNPEYGSENPKHDGTTVARDVAKHEDNHKGRIGFNGCPRNVDLHVKSVYEPTYEVLSSKGFSPDDTQYVANVLEDTVLHMDLSSKCTLDGIVGFFSDVSKHSEPQKGLTEFYEAHIKLNLFLWGDKKQKKDLGKYFENPKEVREAIKNFLERTGINSLKQEVNVYTRTKKDKERTDRTIQVYDRDKIRDFLNNEENWPLISRIYAEEFSKLMKPGYAMPIIGNSGRGTKGRESEKPSGQKTSSEGNEFDKEMRTRSYKEKRVREARSGESCVPSWIDSFEARDIVYESLARKLNFDTDSYTKSQRMPVSWFGKRPFDPEKDKERRLVVGLDEKGKPRIETRRWHDDIQVPIKVDNRGLPETRFVLIDTSDSTKNPIDDKGIGNTIIVPWGDNSVYHYELLSWYGLLEYLKQNHQLQQQSVGLANFSTHTRVAIGLEEAKRLALKPEFKATAIDMDKINGMFAGSGKLVLTLSDGQIQNWDGIKEEFIRRARQHYYVHMQIGKGNAVTEDMEKNGLRVEHIESAKDLANRTITITDSLYRGLGSMQ